MALPFYNIMGPLAPMLADGGIYDPDSGLSYIGPEARVWGGAPGSARNIVVPGTEEITGAKPGGTEPTKIQMTATGNTLSTYTATDGKEFTNFSDYTAHQNKLNTPPGGGGNNVITGSNNVITGGNNNTVNQDSGTKDTEKRNAREFLIAALRPYFASASDAGFLKDLEGIIDDYIKQDYDADTISVLLPQTKPYQERFKGNVARAAAGLSQLSPAEYIQAEGTYNDILKRYNLGDIATRETFANLIGGQVSADELADRVVNVYDRIRNADPALRAEINRVEDLSRGQLTDADFAKALLTGDKGAAQLKRKIATAEIASEARIRSEQLQRQGFAPGLTVDTAEDLQKLGVTREQARAGFEQIALTQPRLTQLAEMYTGETPEATGLQRELEAEQFQGMQSQRRRRLAEQETASFLGQSGTASGISLGRRRTGQI